MTFSHSTYSSSSANALSVTQLNQQARRLLETNFNQVHVEGEISGLAMPSSGHWYFTLKDQSAQIRCAMFRGNNSRLNFRPVEGMLLIVRGRVSLYEGRGDYQLIVEHMENAGTGNLQKAFEAMKLQLAAEGLFDPQYKKPIPSHPKHVGIITSPTGAAVKDILTVLKRRFPSLPVTIIPTLVQGAQAKEGIVRALQQAQASNQFDLLIVGRGGGSIEDLWPFNEEAVARAIFACPIPVVSAVGHEIDFTIADFVADQRAPTPSAAAEMISPDRHALLEQVALLQRKLTAQMQHKLQFAQAQLNASRRQLRHPSERLREHAQRLDDLELHLQRAFQQQIERRRFQLQRIEDRLPSPHGMVSTRTQKIEQLQQRLSHSLQQQLSVHRFSLEKLAANLQAISPLATLARGYSVTRQNQQILTSVQQVDRRQPIEIQLHDGQLHCSVLD